MGAGGVIVAVVLTHQIHMYSGSSSTAPWPPNAARLATRPYGTLATQCCLLGHMHKYSSAFGCVAPKAVRVTARPPTRVHRTAAMIYSSHWCRVAAQQFRRYHPNIIPKIVGFIVCNWTRKSNMCTCCLPGSICSTMVQSAGPRVPIRLRQAGLLRRRRALGDGF